MAVLWNCDYEDGGFGGRLPQQKADGRAVIVTSPTRGTARYSARLRTFGNDTDVNGSSSVGERCGLLSNTVYNIADGDEVWVGFSVLFPDDFGLMGDEPRNGHWSLFGAFHHTHTGFPTIPGQANLNFEIETGTSPTSLQLRCYGGANVDDNREVFYLADFHRNAWYDIVVHGLFTAAGSPGASSGFLEVWVNGDYWEHGARRYRPLLYQGETAYLTPTHYHYMLGRESSVVHGPWRVATTRAEVDPARYGDSGTPVLNCRPAGRLSLTPVTPIAL